MCDVDCALCRWCAPEVEDVEADDLFADPNPQPVPVAFLATIANIGVREDPSFEMWPEADDQ